MYVHSSFLSVELSTKDQSEEPPSALLLAHAALLSARKLARRRAALWYLSAANRLEKCGIVSRATYLLYRELIFQPETVDYVFP
jgi:hypothetical protein